MMGAAVYMAVRSRDRPLFDKDVFPIIVPDSLLAGFRPA